MNIDRNKIRATVMSELPLKATVCDAIDRTILVMESAKAIQQCGDGEPVALNMALTKMKELPRFSFLSPREGGVRRFTDKSGNWIEQYEAVKILDDLISEVE